MIGSLGLRAGLVSLGLLVAFLAVWQMAVSGGTAATGLDPEYAKLMGQTATAGKSAMPGPADVGAKLWEHLRSPFYDNGPNDKGIGIQLAYSLGRVLLGFGLAALANGATSALAVDGSTAALDLAEAGARASGLGDRFAVREADAFEALAALAEESARFELVVCDPPAFAPHKGALDAGLRAYERVARMAAPLVAPGGYLVLCSCSHAADLAQFRAACTRGVGKGGRRAQLIHTGFAGPDHPMLPQLAESGYLKALAFRLD